MDLIKNIDTDWKVVLQNTYDLYGEQVFSELEREEKKFEVFPSRKDIFAAFNCFDMKDLNVVILGQDVYPTKGHGMGMCFSVPSNFKTPPSLRNIFKELEAEYNIKRTNTDLTDWAKSGVLLLNTALTVREGAAGSHINLWRSFTHHIIQHITQHTKNIVYMLWGNHAHSYESYIDKDHNLVLKHTHPSPLSRKPFVGNNHFKMANAYLEQHDRTPISWFS